MISNLPRDLIEEIISRVTLKFMRTVRLTCKKWNTLYKRRSFSKMRIGKEASAARQEESCMAVIMDNDLHLMSFFVDKENPSTENKGKLSCVNEQQVKISQVFHCEGLLLCILRDDTKVVVWNPYLGQTRWIETRYSHRRQNGLFMDWYMYALGYVSKKKSRRSHKILRFFYGYEKRFRWYEIYDFDSSSWTTLDVSPEWLISCYQGGVSLKGNTYFCATETKWGDEFNNRIICFDYTSERFGPLLRFPFDAGGHDNVALSCVREEKLAVLLTHDELNPHELDIWITTKIDPENVSWSKFLTLDTYPVYSITFRGFFIDEENKVARGHT